MCGLAIAATIRGVIVLARASAAWSARDATTTSSSAEQLRLLVERAVLEDVDLDAGEDPERRQLLVELATTSSCSRSRSGDSPLATVSRGEWSVSAMYSWPSVAARLAPSPRSASRRPTSRSGCAGRRAAPRAARRRRRPAARSGLLLQLAQVRRHVARRRLDHHGRGPSPMPLSSSACPRRRRARARRGQSRDRRPPCGRPAPGTSARGPAPAGTRSGRARRPRRCASASIPAYRPSRPPADSPHPLTATLVARNVAEGRDSHQPNRCRGCRHDAEPRRRW